MNQRLAAAENVALFLAAFGFFVLFIIAVTRYFACVSSDRPETSTVLGWMTAWIVGISLSATCSLALILN